MPARGRSGGRRRLLGPRLRPTLALPRRGHHGSPIRYAYLAEPHPALDAYQTLFARIPGSAEMPSAGRPFTERVVAGHLILPRAA
ncbi:MAG: S-adenosylmethionine:tRNA ribosyltransferase-isomerase [bacterium]|nr:S-adenosylmethionine:tRNA ribosyltransferase-isomerase [bacterium]